MFPYDVAAPLQAATFFSKRNLRGSIPSRVRLNAFLDQFTENHRPKKWAMIFAVVRPSTLKLGWVHELLWGMAFWACSALSGGEML